METKGKIITAFTIMGIVIVAAIVAMIINTAANSTYQRSSGRNNFEGVLASSVGSGDASTQVLDLSTTLPNRVSNYMYVTSGKDARITVGFSVSALNGQVVSGKWEKDRINNILSFTPTNTNEELVVKLSNAVTILEGDECKVCIRWVPTWDRKNKLTEIKTDHEMSENMVPLIVKAYGKDQNNVETTIKYKLTAKIIEQKEVTPIYLTSKDKQTNEPKDKETLITEMSQYSKIHFCFIEELKENILKINAKVLSTNNRISLAGNKGELYIYSDPDTVIVAPQDCSGMFSNANFEEIELFNFYTNATASTATMFHGCTNLSKIWVDKATLNMSGVINSSEMFYGCKKDDNHKLQGFYPGVDDAEIYEWKNNENPMNNDETNNFKPIINAKIASAAGGYFTDRYMADRVTNYYNRMFFNAHTLLPGQRLNEKIKQVFNNDSFTYNGIDNKVEQIYFGKISDYSQFTWEDDTAIDVTKDESGNIKLFCNTNTAFILHKVADTDDTSDVRESILLNLDSNDLFANFTNLKSITFGSNVNTQKVEKMDRMFAGCKHLNILDLSVFNTESVESMQYMFSNCERLITIFASSDIHSYNVDASTTGREMFEGCSYLRGYYSTEAESYSYNVWQNDQTASDNSVVAQEEKGYITDAELKTNVMELVNAEFGNMLIKGTEFSEILNEKLDSSVLNEIIFAKQSDYTSVSGEYEDVSFMSNGNVKLYVGSDKAYVLSSGNSLIANKDCSDMLRGAQTRSVTMKNVDISKVTNMNHMFDSDYIMAIFTDNEWDKTNNVTSSENMFGPMLRGYWSTGADVESINYCLNYINPDQGSSGRDVGSAIFASSSNAFNDVNGNANSKRGMFTNIKSDDVNAVSLEQKATIMANISASAPYMLKSGNIFDGVDGADSITSIVFGATSGYSQFDGQTGVDVSYYSDGNVKLYIDDTTAYILSTGEKIYGSTYGNIFNIQNVPYLASIDFANVDTRYVASMESMFSVRQYIDKPLVGQLTRLDLSMFDTHKVENMKEMFYATSLQVIYVSNSLWNNENVSSSDNMFLKSDQLRGFYNPANDSSVIKYCAYAGSESDQASVNVIKAVAGINGYLTDISISIGNIFDNMIDNGVFKAKMNELKGVKVEDASVVIKQITFGKTTDFTSQISDIEPLIISKFGTDNVKLYTKIDDQINEDDPNNKTVNAYVYVLSENEIYFDFDSTSMFEDLITVETIELVNINTSMVRKFDKMFKNCASLTRIYASAGVDTTNKLSVHEGGSDVFAGCSSLKATLGSSTFEYAPSSVGIDYAKIYEGDSSNPGYFTNINLKPTTTP